MVFLTLKHKNNKSSGINAMLIIGLLFSFQVLSQDNTVKNADKTTQKLNDIQRAITKQKRTLNSTKVRISDLEQQLKTDDIAIGKIAKALSNTNSNLNNTQKKLGQLSTEKSQLETEKQQQEQILAKQLRAAYSTGHHDYLKLILNQENPASVQRTITHYQYLNKARINEIKAFQATIIELNDVTARHQRQMTQLKQLTQDQSHQKQILELSKAKQKQTLKALNNKKLTDQQKLAKLEQEETSIVALLKKIAEAAQVTENFQGLSKLKRKLSWPVKGKLRHSFGSKKQGYLKWKGVFLSAPIGRQVKTIHSGTILFSDWLKGYGLVSVVDHGDGYMSLYGHNQALLKSVGTRVEAGEPIALIGQSGGKAQSGLYFEIRHAGKAMNPKLWCK
jgi:septal ring factor EnvC (AmiA/AmiB activator)